MLVALFASGVSFAIVLALGKELWLQNHPNVVAAFLVAGPLLTFMIPQFAGMRAGDMDMAPVRYLHVHSGTNRIANLGPLDFNFPARYGIASINYFALPVPYLRTQYINSNLSPGTDLTSYSGNAPGQRDALLQHLSEYSLVGVRYVVLDSSDMDLGRQHYQPLSTPQINFARRIVQGAPDLTGTIPAGLPLRSIGAVSVIVGSYYGTASGPVTATLCIWIMHHSNRRHCKGLR